MKVLTILLLVCSLGSICQAQQISDPPAAPVPSPVFTAQKVFISNATGETALPPGNPDLTYNEFYAAMKSWGRFQLVSAPGDADLVFEIRFVGLVTPTFSGNSGVEYQFRLAILDPKSRVVLWAFSRSVPGSTNKTKNRQYFDGTLAALVDDLKKLVTAATAAPSN